jgi:hypothetical protein
MNRLMKVMLITCGAAALGVGAFAQNYGQPAAKTYFQDRERDQDRGRDRDSWDRERMAREYRGAFYDRLQNDLTRAENNRYLEGDDYRRFGEARRQVGEFQAKWSRGIFDARDMDGAIASVQRVIEIPTLHRDDRDALREDLESMRRFRAHMEERRY